MKDTNDSINLKTNIGTELTDKELAVRWWNRLSDNIQNEYIIKEFPELIMEDLDTDTVHWIWLKKQQL